MIQIGGLWHSPVWPRSWDCDWFVISRIPVPPRVPRMSALLGQAQQARLPLVSFADPSGGASYACCRPAGIPRPALVLCRAH